MNKKDRIYLLMWLYKQEQQDEEVTIRDKDCPHHGLDSKESTR